MSSVPSLTQRAKDVERELRRLRNPRRAEFVQRFFKSGPGQYGEGDLFLGLSVPQIRGVAKNARDLPLDEINALLASPWHEVRLLALIALADRYPKADARTQQRAFRLYLDRTDRINNWDLVDVSAGAIVGAHLLTRSRAPLYRLAKSQSLWERRIAIVATQYLITRGHFEDTLRIAVLLFGDREDLIHKAVGWMLREVGKRDEAVLLAFLDSHAGAMPRTTLRYALERLSPARRKRYMTIPRHTERSTRR